MNIQELNESLKTYLENFWHVEDANTLSEEQIKRAFFIKFACDDMEKISDELAERKNHGSNL